MINDTSEDEKSIHDIKIPDVYFKPLWMIQRDLRQKQMEEIGEDDDNDNETYPHDGWSD